MRFFVISVGICWAGVFLSTNALAASGGLAGVVHATPAKYVAESVVYIVEAKGPFTPKTVEMDQKALQFIPHVLDVTAGDTVVFLNHDNVAHMVLSQGDESYSLGPFKAGESSKHVFTKTGTYAQLCPLHADMLAYIFVGQNPYHAAVGADGTYSITDIPPGTYQVALWNSHLHSPMQTVTVGEGQKVTLDLELKR